MLAKPRFLDQEAADLDLRLHGGRELAVGLEDHAIADHRRRVALLDRRALDLDLRRDLDAGQRRGRPAADRAAGTRDLRPAADRIEGGERKLGAGHGIVEGAYLGAAAHLGQREGEQRPAVAQRLVVVAGRERQEVALRRAAAGELDLDLGQEVVVLAARQLGPGRDLGIGDGQILGAEPALVGKERRQDVARQLARALALEHRAPAIADHERDEVGQGLRDRLVPARQLGRLGEHEPVKAVARQRQEIGQIPDRRERAAPEQLDRDAALEAAEVELDRLRRAREVGNAQDAVALVLAQVGQDLAVARVEQPQAAAAERLVRLADRDHALHPVEQGRRLALLGLDVDRLVAVDRIHDRRQVEPGRIGAREAAVAVGRPLHRRAHAVAIAEENVVAHADLVAVVDDRRARQRQQQAVHQLDLAQVVLEQGCQPAPDAEVEPRPLVGGIEVPEIVPLLVGHHLERQLVVVAQENSPLAAARDVRGLAQNVGDRMPVLLGDRHVHPRHHGKVERHVALVAVAEIGQHVFRPLVGLGEQHPAGEIPVHLGPDALQDRMRLGQVLVDRAVALDQIRDRIEAQAVDPHVQPDSAGCAGSRAAPADCRS